MRTQVFVPIRTTFRCGSNQRRNVGSLIPVAAAASAIVKAIRGTGLLSCVAVTSESSGVLPYAEDRTDVRPCPVSDGRSTSDVVHEGDTRLSTIDGGLLSKAPSLCEKLTARGP